MSGKYVAYGMRRWDVFFGADYIICRLHTMHIDGAGIMSSAVSLIIYLVSLREVVSRRL